MITQLCKNTVHDSVCNPTKHNIHREKSVCSQMKIAILIALTIPQIWRINDK